LIRLHYHTMADVSELVNIANGRAMAIVDWQGNYNRLGIWIYSGSVDGFNRRLA
jgi:hypothetical protein